MAIIPNRCPCCGSAKWVQAAVNQGKSGFSVGKAAIGGFLFGPVGLLGGALGKRHTVVQMVCQNCHFTAQYQIN